MKYILASMVILSCLAALIESYVLDREKLQHVLGMVRECHLSGHPIEIFRNPNVSPPEKLEETKCSVGCLMRKLDMITEYYTVNIDGMKALKSFFFPDNNFHVNHAGSTCTKEELHKTCLKVRGKNDCDLAGKFFSCLINHCNLGKHNYGFKSVY